MNDADWRCTATLEDTRCDQPVGHEGLHTGSHGGPVPWKSLWASITLSDPLEKMYQYPAPFTGTTDVIQF